MIEKAKELVEELRCKIDPVAARKALLPKMPKLDPDTIRELQRKQKAEEEFRKNYPEELVSIERARHLCRNVPEELSRKWKPSDFVLQNLATVALLNAVGSTIASDYKYDVEDLAATMAANMYRQAYERVTGNLE